MYFQQLSLDAILERLSTLDALIEDVKRDNLSNLDSVLARYERLQKEREQLLVLIETV